MGISEGLDGGGAAVDCSVGTIVWVRRRNGSWWPGRILGPNELAASNIMSPRSGTPVKLLGREDASVDWYNLEKSKRVKAFRCGEFDDCIRKAEASQGMPIKKREKYARREDAIIHALELEKQHQERQLQKVGTASNYMSNRIPGTLKELSSYTPENHGGMEGERNYYKSINFKSQLLSKKPDSFLDEESHGSLDAQKGNLGKIPNWEDDKSEAIPRMRGLQDFGLQIVPSKRKLSASSEYDSSHKPLPVDNHTYPFSNGEHTIGNTNHVSSIKNSASFKRKRSLGGVTDESFVKRRDRRRPLVQVLKSSAKMPMCQPLHVNGDAMPNSTLGQGDQGSQIFRAKRSKCVYLPADSSDYLDRTKSPSDHLQVSPSHIAADNYIQHPGSLTEENSSGFVEAEESDSTETEYLDTDMEEEATGVSDSRSSGRYDEFGGSFQTGNMGNDELDDCALSSDTSQLHPHDQTSDIAADMGVSKWQLKGKRNIRNLSKRPMEAMDWRDSIITADRCNGSNNGSYLEAKGNIRNRGEELSYAYDEDDLVDNDFGQNQVVGHGNRRRRYPLMLKASSRGQRRSTSSIASSDEDSQLMSSSMRGPTRLSEAVLRQYWEQSEGCFNPIYPSHFVDGLEPMLMDVDLKVQASYHGERVPLVSLMSRLNGKAIVGHPVQIEAMEDGTSNHLVSTNVSGNKLPEYDGNTGLPPVWRTARRTAMHRIPRPHPSASLEGEEFDPSQCSDLESEPPFKKLNAGRSSQKVTQPKKGFLQTHRPVVEKKFPKKLLKKISLSSQKTRTLSSFATEQKVGGKKIDLKINPKSSDLDSAIKPGKALHPVSCIPVKLVFSRILEAVVRQPSNIEISSAEQKPS